ncbi:unnamed protein product, partial [Polarella glacialis]
QTVTALAALTTGEPQVVLAGSRSQQLAQLLGRVDKIHPREGSERGAIEADSDFRALAKQIWSCQEEDLASMRQDLGMLCEEVSASQQRLEAAEAADATLRFDLERLQTAGGPKKATVPSSPVAPPFDSVPLGRKLQ